MYLFTIISIFVLGTIIGSFLNVVILRIGTNIGFLKSSFCFSCRKILHFYDLVPIFSFLILRGKCRKCKGKIHFQYPVVELISGLLFIFVWVHEMGRATLFDIFVSKTASIAILPYVFLLWAIASVLLAIAVYDIKHKIIPNVLVYTFAFLAFAMLIRFSLSSALSNLSAGIVFFILFACVWYFSRGTWMGFGDAKLVLGIGWLLGISMGTAALIISFWTGAVVGLLLLWVKRLKKLFPYLKKLTMKSEIPFAPFLILGTFISYFWNITFFDIASIFVI